MFEISIGFECGAMADICVLVVVDVVVVVARLS